MEGEENECYICYDSTINRSPCICRAPLCTECYIEYLGYSDICRICNTEFIDEDLMNETCFEDLTCLLFLLCNVFFTIFFGSLMISITSKKSFELKISLEIIFCGIIIDAIIMGILSNIFEECFEFFKNYCIYTITRITLYWNC